jgi:hypothetical protein
MISTQAIIDNASCTKPRKKPNAAPLPNIGQMLAQVLTPKSAAVQQQAAVVPVPKPNAAAVPAPVAPAALPAPVAAVPQRAAA